MAENRYRAGRGFNSRYSRSELLLGSAKSVGEIRTEETLKELHEQDIFWEYKEAQQNGFDSDLFRRIHSRKSSGGNTIVGGEKRMGESAPMNVPNWPRTIKTSHDSLSEEEDEDEMVLLRPPHELVAHYNDKIFSVVEGCGRTLKGRDLRKLRDAIFRQTGFMD